MKSYTDIEQSRKLAEILPLESPDGYWDFQIDGYNLIADNLGYYKNDSEIPCWSLAALFDILPANYIDVNDIVYHPNLMKTKDGRYMVIYNVSQYTSLCNNPVDACVEMILKLKEKNLL